MTRRADRRRYAILGVLAENGRTSGIDLCLLLHRSSGTIYPDLVTLESDGRIVAEWVDQPQGRPRRRLYRLPTDEERHAHQRRVRGWKQATETAPVRLIPHAADGCT